MERDGEGELKAGQQQGCELHGGPPALIAIDYRARDRSASRLPLITTFTMKSVTPLAFGDILPSGKLLSPWPKGWFFPQRNWLRLKLSIPENAVTDNQVAGSAKGHHPPAGSDEASDRLRDSNARWFLRANWPDRVRKQKFKVRHYPAPRPLHRSGLGLTASRPRRTGRRITMSAIRQATHIDTGPIT